MSRAPCIPAALLAVAAVAGCSSEVAATAEQSAASPSPAAPAAPSPTPSPTPPPEPPQPLTLAFAGDVHFERRVEARLDSPEEPLFGPITAVLADADVAVVNLETAITERGAPQPKTYTFRAPAAALRALADAGVDVVSLANNHAVDFGADGLEDTLAAAAASPVAVVGIGDDALGAYAPRVLDVRGRSVAVLAASQVRDHTLSAWTAGTGRPGIASAESPRLLEAVAAAATAADVVVVYAHWGQEREGCPTGAQQRLAAALAEAGADVVVGTHAHRLQGAGWLGDTYVAYGLGNFLWYSSNSATADRTGVLVVTLAEDGTAVEAALTPADIDDRGVPVPLGPDRRDAAVAEFEELRACAGLAATPAGSGPVTPSS